MAAAGALVCATRNGIKLALWVRSRSDIDAPRVHHSEGAKRNAVSVMHLLSVNFHFLNFSESIQYNTVPTEMQKCND